MSCERSKAAGLSGLRKQLTEAKEVPLEFKRKKERIYMPGGRREGKAQVCSLGKEEVGNVPVSEREKESTLHWVLHPHGFYHLSEGKDLRGIPRGGSQ